MSKGGREGEGRGEGRIFFLFLFSAARTGSREVVQSERS